MKYLLCTPLYTFSFFVCLHFLHWHVHRDPRRTRACLDCSINRCSLDLGPARHIWNLYKFHVLCPPRSLQPESVVRIPATISVLICLLYIYNFMNMKQVLLRFFVSLYFSEFIAKSHILTRLSYNCAHLRSTKESVTI